MDSHKICSQTYVQTFYLGSNNKNVLKIILISCINISFGIFLSFFNIYFIRNLKGRARCLTFPILLAPVALGYIKNDRNNVFLKLHVPVYILYIFIHMHIRSVKKGTVLIDSSTVDPDVSKTLAAAAETQGTVFLDAPVSGGEVLA
jgi:hypothetical protein